LFSSFIIPCKNEENNIENCLKSIFKQNYSELYKEVIVVDNNSTDQTVEIISKYKSVRLLRSDAKSISKLRNIGASYSACEWLAFIDADVELSCNWFIEVNKALEKKIKEGYSLNKIITGSVYGIKNNSTLIEKVWYLHLKNRPRNNVKYINGGNIVLSRDLFNTVQGFNEEYLTGEDEKLCSDCRKIGALIYDSPGIVSYHNGYPKNLKDFYRRERWHGQGIIKYIFKPWMKKELILSFQIIFSILGLIVGILLQSVLIAFFTLLIILIIPLLCFAGVRIGVMNKYIFALVGLYIIYGIAKMMCLYKITAAQNISKTGCRPKVFY
jgi:glycosyltransferase involved in cell wall biosynthesis